MHNSRQCASKVGKFVYPLQSLTFHCDDRLLVRLGLGLDDMSLAWPAVVLLLVFIYSGIQ